MSAAMNHGSRRRARGAGVRLAAGVAAACVLGLLAAPAVGQLAAPPAQQPAPLTQPAPPAAADRAPAPKDAPATKPADTAPTPAPVPPARRPDVVVPQPPPQQHSVARIFTAIGWFALGAIVGVIAGHAGILYALGLVHRRKSDVVARVAAPSAVADTPGAREAFNQQYRDFRDIYGAIWRAAESNDESPEARQKLIARWDERIKRLGQAPLLNAWTNALARGNGQPREAARQWVASLQAWGMKLDHPRTIAVNEQTLARFHVFPEARSGTAEVKEPCWMFQGVVLQKGNAVSTGG